MKFYKQTEKNKITDKFLNHLFFNLHFIVLIKLK